MARSNTTEKPAPYRETPGRFVRRLILLTPWEEATPHLSKSQEVQLWSVSHTGWLTKKVRGRIAKLQAGEKERTKILRDVADSLPLSLAGVRTQGRKPGYNTRLLFVRPRDIEVVCPMDVLDHMEYTPELIVTVIKSVTIDLSAAIKLDVEVMSRLLDVLHSGMPELSVGDRDLFDRCLKVAIDQAKYRQLVRAGAMRPFPEGCVKLTRGTTKILPEVY